MANTNVMEETVKVVEEATEVAEPVKETVRAIPKKGKTALIIGGTAVGVVTIYFTYKKLIEPKLGRKKQPKKAHVNVDKPAEEVIPVEAEPVTEAEVKKSGKKK